MTHPAIASELAVTRAAQRTVRYCRASCIISPGKGRDPPQFPHCLSSRTKNRRLFCHLGEVVLLFQINVWKLPKVTQANNGRWEPYRGKGGVTGLRKSGRVYFRGFVCRECQLATQEDDLEAFCGMLIMFSE